MNYIGIDPSLRHTGVCILLFGGGQLFFEIKTGDLTVVEAAQLIKQRLAQGLTPTLRDGKSIIAMERQLPSSGVLFHTQMVILDLLCGTEELNGAEPWLLLPLPIQLKSYMIKRLNLGVKTKSETVEGVKTAIRGEGRLSSHCAEAYCLARLADDVHFGRWKFRRPSKETPLVREEVMIRPEDF